MQRSAAIRKIQEDLTSLNELFTEVAALVEHQNYPVQKINEDAEQTVEDYKQANEHLTRGIFSARNARKWKWWILFIVCKFSPILTMASWQRSNSMAVLIIAIIVLVVVLWCKLGNHC